MEPQANHPIAEQVNWLSLGQVLNSLGVLSFLAVKKGIMMPLCTVVTVFKYLAHSRPAPITWCGYVFFYYNIKSNPIPRRHLKGRS